MAISEISLLNPDNERVFEDKGAKSVSFFCLKRPIRIDRRLIDELKQVSRNNGGKNARVCLHSGPEDRHHDMVILENKGKYYRPHRHNGKGEAFHVIEGRLGVFSFDESGTVIDACILGPGDIYRVEAGSYHSVLPVTEQVIYHENKPGPFEGDRDSIFPEWAPDGSDAEVVEEYVNVLRGRFDD